MKKTVLFVLLTALTLGCSNDDDKNTTQIENTIHGKWSFVQSYEFIEEEILEDGLTVHNHNCVTIKDFIEFSPNNSGLERYHFGNCDFTDNSFTYSKNMDTLVLDFENLEWEVVIKEVSNEVLILKENNDFGRIFEYNKVN